MCAAVCAPEPFRAERWRVVGPVRLAQLRGDRHHCLSSQPEYWRDASDEQICYGSGVNTWSVATENTTSFNGFR